MHRFDLSQGSGSGGALSIVQSSTGGGAIQGQVGTPVDTTLKDPFGIFGEASDRNSFGIGVIGVTYSGYGELFRRRTVTV